MNGELNLNDENSLDKPQQLNFLTNESSAFDKLVEAVYKVNPILSEKLQAKYEADREAFVSYVKSNTTSSSPKDWAKKSCINCNSKGIILYLDGHTSICGCASKNYTKWIKTLRISFNKLRGQ